ncbi:DM13 domain-containing protein [Staphylococcus caprae]|uniref:DM13 domain-containing protein n=1 Tax=Staphylococcus caprae TaxID=29380 RepID=UPI0024B500D9|nr:DM13 domain-containing protein [Staphylococcus caprae]MDI9231495.1 DM13 domain-containing protein [Staphylococcus caprae]
MNTKYLFAVGAIVTSLTLGACGNSNSDQEHSQHKDKQQEESKVKTDKTKKLSGTFKSKNGEKVEGTAKIENGKLMLENYKSSKGPDLYVFLTKDGDIKSGKKISTVDYNKSKHTFNLKNVDLNKYNEVTIYCEKAHVIFGGAQLK